MKNIPYHIPEIYNNFYEMLSGLYNKCPERIAVQFTQNNQLVKLSYQELIGEISSIYAYFRSNNITGQNIGIIAENRYEYITIYLATVFSNVIAPIDKEINTELLDSTVKNFDISIIFYSNKTKKLVNSINTKVRLINIDDYYNELIRNNYHIEEFWENIKDTDSNRFSTLAFTSGTTGEIKGAMLSQYNIVSNLKGALQNNRLHRRTLLMLPMNHTYAFNPGVLTALYNGSTLSLNMDLKRFASDMKLYNPWYIGVVPMVVEGMYNTIIREARRTGKEKLLNRMIKISKAFRKIGIDLRHIFFGRLINKGLRVIVSGGAALNPYYVDRFDELGIKVLNGYGLTECSPLISVNREVYNVKGSVGTIIKEDEVRIASDGEILVKGPNVMLGYYKDEAATKECMENGYFKTGDLGYVENNVLFITGRKKNLIILGNGKNFSPEVVESKLLEISYIKECIVTTRNNKITALIFPEGDASSIKDDIKALNKNLPGYMAIESYEILTEEFEKNSNKKIVRNKYVG